ncbi:MAG: GerMN domain-containing protein [Candidatus Dojkabacteria bacterium]|nr:GerMN domain-containing protein [Candidatus Dojkabacteria bacterium]
MRKRYIVLIVFLVLIAILLPLFFIFKDQIIEALPIFNNGGQTDEKKEVTKTAEGLVYEMVTPLPNDELDCDFEIEGSISGTWFFEGSAPVKLINSNGTEILSFNITVEGDWMEEDMVTFKASVECTEKCDGGAKLVFLKNNPSDSTENDDSFEIPVSFKTLCDDESVMIVKVYFGNSEKDPEALDCTKVYAVNRKIIKTEAVGRASLLELLEGPTATETTAGYLTSIPDGVKLNSLSITKGTARVDFDNKLQEGVGGTCLVDRIKAQITQTLKQFPTVDKVIISINGESEAILQP